ncbi:MAG: TIGR02117 family protein [Sphingomicrobium sp.]
MGEGKAKRVRSRRRRRSRPTLVARILTVILAIPAAYLLAALAGALIPVNSGWTEPEEGTTVYLRDNGIHVDILLPANAHGLDWTPLLPARHFTGPPIDPRWFAFGAGERRVYLDTPTWWDVKPRTIWAGLTGGDRVIHVERVANPGTRLRAIRLRPEEYRRLWTSIRAEFDLDAQGLPTRVDHPGYWHHDAFYEGRGEADAFDTCNQWVADRLRVARVETSLWTPFVQGLVWRYRRAGQST